MHEYDTELDGIIVQLTDLLAWVESVREALAADVACLTRMREQLQQFQQPRSAPVAESPSA